MVRRTVKFIKDNLTAVLLGLIVLLLLALFIIRVGYTQLTGAQFNNWLSPLISLLGFGLVYGTLKQMQKDSRRDISKEKKEFYFTKIKSLLETNLNFEVFSVESNSADKINKLDFRPQYLLFKLEMGSSENRKRIELIKSGKEITNDNSRQFTDTIFQLYLFKLELGMYYNSLFSELLRIWKSDMILEHKKIIIEFLPDKLESYLFLFSGGNLEFLKRVGATFEVENFHSGMISHLHQFIINTPEIRKIFQKYYPSD